MSHDDCFVRRRLLVFDGGCVKVWGGITTRRKKPRIMLHFLLNKVSMSCLG